MFFSFLAAYLGAITINKKRMLEFHKVMEMENKLLTSSFYRYIQNLYIQNINIQKLLSPFLKYPLVEMQVYLLFFESKEGKPTLSWVLQ